MHCCALTKRNTHREHKENTKDNLGYNSLCSALRDDSAKTGLVCFGP